MRTFGREEEGANLRFMGLRGSAYPPFRLVGGEAPPPLTKDLNWASLGARLPFFRAQSARKMVSFGAEGAFLEKFYDFSKKNGNENTINLTF